MLRIRIRTPTDPVVVHEVTGPGPVRFGRDPDNPLVLDATYVSRSHGEIACHDGRWRVTCWGSRTPVERCRGMERERIPDRVPTLLCDGDVLQILHTRLEIEIDDGTMEPTPDGVVTASAPRSLGDDASTRVRSIVEPLPLLLAPREPLVEAPDAALLRACEGAALGLLTLLEVRFPDVAQHSRRAGHLAMQLGARLAESDGSTTGAPWMASGDAWLRGLRIAGWAHDAGKLALVQEAPDRPRPSVAARRHPELGARCVAAWPRPPELAELPAWILAHHERLDGSGYPRGAGASEQPLPVRILQIADVFDAAAWSASKESGRAAVEGPSPIAPPGCALHCLGPEALDVLDVDAGCAALQRQADAQRLDRELVSLWIDAGTWRDPCPLHAGRAHVTP